MPSMRRAILAHAALFATILCAGNADAHFILQSPAAATAQDALGDPQKTAPCGPNGAGTPSGAVTTYQAGETITIKVNFVGFIRTHGGVDPETYELRSWRDYMNTSPQMIAALLKQLTEAAGVKQVHIGVGDSLAYFADEYYDMLHERFPDVQYLDCQGKSGRDKWDLSSTALHWSCDTTGCEPDSGDP